MGAKEKQAPPKEVFVFPAPLTSEGRCEAAAESVVNAASRVGCNKRRYRLASLFWEVYFLGHSN